MWSAVVQRALSSDLPLDEVDQELVANTLAQLCCRRHELLEGSTLGMVQRIVQSIYPHLNSDGVTEMIEQLTTVNGCLPRALAFHTLNVCGNGRCKHS